MKVTEEKYVYTMSIDEIEKLYAFVKANPQEELFELVCVETGIGTSYTIRARSLKNPSAENLSEHGRW